MVRFNEVREEFVASREGVTMCDYSSFAKFDVWSAGTEAVEFLQKMCSNDIDVPIGHIVHTGMHNKFGGKKSSKPFLCYLLLENYQALLW